MYLFPKAGCSSLCYNSQNISRDNLLILLEADGEKREKRTYSLQEYFLTPEMLLEVFGSYNIPPVSVCPSGWCNMRPIMYYGGVLLSRVGICSPKNLTLATHSTPSLISFVIFNTVSHFFFQPISSFEKQLQKISSWKDFMKIKCVNICEIPTCVLHLIVDPWHIVFIILW